MPLHPEEPRELIQILQREMRELRREIAATTQIFEAEGERISIRLRQLRERLEKLSNV